MGYLGSVGRRLPDFARLFHVADDEVCGEAQYRNGQRNYELE